MRPFTFLLLLLAQRADAALRAERLRARPDPEDLTRLDRRRRRLAARLRRSLAAPLPAGG